jgi:hypothetical protein
MEDVGGVCGLLAVACVGEERNGKIPIVQFQYGATPV